MCCWPLRAPTPLQPILSLVIDPILVSFAQIRNLRDPNLVTTFYFYELTHFFRSRSACNKGNRRRLHAGIFQIELKNTLLFICSTNIMVRLLIVSNYEELSYTKNPKMCDPILVTLLKMRPIIVNPVVKMRPHPAAHPHQPLIRKYPSPPPGSFLFAMPLFN